MATSGVGPKSVSAPLSRLPRPCAHGAARWRLAPRSTPAHLRRAFLTRRLRRLQGISSAAALPLDAATAARCVVPVARTQGAQRSACIAASMTRGSRRRQAVRPQPGGASLRRDAEPPTVGLERAAQQYGPDCTG